MPPDPGVMQEAKERARGGSSATSTTTTTPVVKDPRQDLIDQILGERSGDTVEDRFTNEFFWQDSVVDRIYDDIKEVAKAYEMDLDFVTGWFQGQELNLVNYLQNAIKRGGAYLSPNQPEGIAALFQIARHWVGLQFPAYGELFSGSGSVGGAGSGRGPGGGGGPRRPTADEIRAQFDVNQMTETVNQMSRGLVLAESKDARAIANAYVNAIVKNPEQQLDFETFARQRILTTNRAKAIYKDKPESQSHEQFLQPYVQAAMQMIGPGFGDQLADVAIGGARLAASPDAFRQRLSRERQVQTSTPFLAKLGEQVRGIKGVLR